MHRRGHRAKIPSDVRDAALIATAATLRAPLGLPPRNPLSAGTTSYESHLLEDNMEGWRSFKTAITSNDSKLIGKVKALLEGKGDCLTPDLARIIPVVLRAYRELFSEVAKGYKNGVFQEAEAEDRRDARAEAKAATFAKLLLEPLGEFEEGATLGPYQAVRSAYFLGATSGPYLHDWLVANNIPEAMEAQIVEGKGSDLGVVIANTVSDEIVANTYGGNLMETLGRHYIHDQYRGPTGGTVNFYDRAGDRWNRGDPAVTLPVRERRKPPHLPGYSIYDLAAAGWMWHALETVDPYIGSMQEKRQEGPPGPLVGIFDSGEHLVVLPDVRAVQIEGKLRGLCLRHRQTAESYMQRGPVLSIRQPEDNRIIATVALRKVKNAGGGEAYTIYESKGANNSTLTDPHDKDLISSIGRSAGTTNVLSMPDLAEYIKPRKSSSGDIHWTQRAGTHLPLRRKLEYPIDVNRVQSTFDITGTSPEKQLSLLASLNRSIIPQRAGRYHHDYDPTQQVLKELAEKIRGMLPYNTLASVETKLEGSHGQEEPRHLYRYPSNLNTSASWKHSARGRVTTQRSGRKFIPPPFPPILRARDAEISGFAGTFTFPMSDRHSGTLSTLLKVASIEAHQRSQDDDQARKNWFQAPRKFSNIMKGKDARTRWTGALGNRLYIQPRTRWARSSGWGRTSTWQQGSGYQPPSPSLYMKTQSAKATYSPSKSVIFNMRVRKIEFTAATARAKPKLAIEIEGDIFIRGARRGYLNQKQVAKLVNRFWFWARKEALLLKKTIGPNLLFTRIGDNNWHQLPMSEYANAENAGTGWDYLGAKLHGAVSHRVKQHYEHSVKRLKEEMAVSKKTMAQLRRVKSAQLRQEGDLNRLRPQDLRLENQRMALRAYGLTG